MSQPDYAAVMVVSPVSGCWELMSSGGRIVIFDTAQVAWEWLPLLGQGRLYTADEQAGSIRFHELSGVLPNRARVVSPYRPDEPFPWRSHVIWSDWWSDLGHD